MTKKKKNNFSKHISWNEAFGSKTAKKLKIANEPNDEQLSNMKILADEFFEPLRERIGEPIIINSFFGSLLNLVIISLTSLVKVFATEDHLLIFLLFLNSNALPILMFICM